jgi:hypothetical protein
MSLTTIEGYDTSFPLSRANLFLERYCKARLYLETKQTSNISVGYAELSIVVFHWEIYPWSFINSTLGDHSFLTVHQARPAHLHSPLVGFR